MAISILLPIQCPEAKIFAIKLLDLIVSNKMKPDCRNVPIRN